MQKDVDRTTSLLYIADKYFDSQNNSVGDGLEMQKVNTDNNCEGKVNTPETTK